MRLPGIFQMRIVLIVSVIVGLLAGSCTLSSPDTSAIRPTVTILSPANGSQVPVGQPTTIQAHAADARGVTRIEIKVDGALVGMTPSSTAQGQPSLGAVQTWTFAQVGSHVITAQAFNAAGQASDRTAITVQAVASLAQQVTPASPPTAPPITPPTSVPPTAVPPTSAPPTAMPPTSQPPAPVINFSADAATIIAGDCTWIRWTVDNVKAVYLQEGAGAEQGVGSHDQRQVCPKATTTYKLRIALNDGNSTTRTLTMTVKTIRIPVPTALTGLFFYDRAAGLGEFYKTDGAGNLVLLKTSADYRKSWSRIVAGNFGGDSHTDLFFYDWVAGLGEFDTTDGAGNLVLLKTSSSYRKSWNWIIPGDFGGDGHTDLFFYDRGAGLGEFYTTDGAGNLALLKASSSYRKSWDWIVAGNFGGDSHTDLFFYDSAAGWGEFYKTDGAGNLVLLKSSASYYKGWDWIVAGDFGGDSHTDLFFYDSAAGLGEFDTTDGAGNLVLLKTSSSYHKGWYEIVPGDF